MLDIGASHVLTYYMHLEVQSIVADYRPWPLSRISDIEWDAAKERDGDAS